MRASKRTRRITNRKLSLSSCQIAMKGYMFCAVITPLCCARSGWSGLSKPPACQHQYEAAAVIPNSERVPVSPSNDILWHAVSFVPPSVGTNSPSIAVLRRAFHCPTDERLYDLAKSVRESNKAANRYRGLDRKGGGRGSNSRIERTLTTATTIVSFTYRQ